jgi:hypothetical protein
MAKRKHNKSLAIREHYEQNPGDKPKAIVEALKAKGIPADAAYVSMILSKLRKGSGGGRAAGAAPAKAGRKGKKRRGRPAGSGKQTVVAVFSRPAGGKFGFEELNLAKQLVSQMGSVAAAKQLIDALA